MEDFKKENDVYEFEGTSEFEKYYNEDSFYGAFNISTNSNLPHSQTYNNEFGDKSIYFINLAGKCQRLFIGCKYKIKARLEFTKRYNCWQYVPINIKTIKPTTLEDNKKFLNSILTQNQTDSLLEVYPDVVDMVINNKEIDLTKIKGIKDKTFSKIKDKILNSYGMSDLLVMLQPLGVTLKQIESIKKLDENCDIIKKKITENPYILTKIKGLGFKRVDGIALKINPKIRVSRFRTIAFINYFFKDLGNSKGDTLCKISSLRNEASNQIPECLEILDKIIEENKETQKLLYINDDKIGLTEYINNEINILKLLYSINKYSVNYTEKVDINKGISSAENLLGFRYTEEQRNSIKSTLNNGVTLITAKAGSGKTTVIRGILEVYKNVAKIGLCSLSAKAARRMTEVTGYEASTIHSLLGYGQGVGNELFEYNANKQLDLDMLIVDEATMVNADLFLALLQAFSPTGKLILVFDSEQLPPIGYGNIATDLLSSKFNICKLTKVQRQALDSGILTDANMIREQKFPIEKPLAKEIHGNNGDLCYMFRNDREQMRNIMINYYMKTIDKTSIEDTVIIVPRKKNCINSTIEINKIIQDKLISDDKISLNRGDVKFKLGCRVIQRTNNKDKNVVNGELGYITRIFQEVSSKDGKLKYYFDITFDDGKVVNFERDDLSNIELGYCLTVHSVQGSEWSNVVIGIDATHYSLLGSNLLYTALTRAKKKCLLVAEPSAFKLCIQKKSNKRHTYLNEYFKKQKIN